VLLIRYLPSFVGLLLDAVEVGFDAVEETRGSYCLLGCIEMLHLFGAQAQAEFCFSFFNGILTDLADAQQFYIVGFLGRQVDGDVQAPLSVSYTNTSKLVADDGPFQCSVARFLLHSVLLNYQLAGLFYSL